MNETKALASLYTDADFHKVAHFFATIATLRSLGHQFWVEYVEGPYEHLELKVSSRG